MTVKPGPPAPGRQFALDLAPAPPSFDAEDFLTAPTNAVAVGLLERWPDWPARRMALCGPAGGGKSHLASVWRTRAAARAVTGEDLKTLSPPVLLDGVPALLIDPIEDGAPGGIPETALLHVLNYAAERGQGVLLVARTPPARWPVALPDLASRLAALTVGEIAPPDDALLEALIVKLLRDRQLTAPLGLPSYLARRIERSGAAAAAVVARLDRAALAAGQPIGLALARALLEDRPPELPFNPPEDP